MYKTEEEFLEKLKKSDTALTEMAKSLHCDVADLIPLADDFSNATISTEDWHSTFSAFKKHFLKTQNQVNEDARTD